MAHKDIWHDAGIGGRKGCPIPNFYAKEQNRECRKEMEKLN